VLNLTPEVEQSLAAAAKSQGLAPADYALHVLQQELAEQQRRQQAASLLQSWIDHGNPAEQKTTYEYLTRVLDEDRSSDRKLFPADLKGVNW
jgi:hypothetical protein